MPYSLCFLVFGAGVAMVSFGFSGDCSRFLFSKLFSFLASSFLDLNSEFCSLEKEPKEFCTKLALDLLFIILFLSI